MTLLAPSAYKSFAGYLSAAVVANTPPDSAFWRQFYKALRAYYQMNGLYEALNDGLTQFTAHKSALPLRNPAYRVVEFYAAKLWPGALPDALPILAENEAIIEPIEQIWQWSNWGSRKQRAARWFALFGDLFIKTPTRTDSAGRVTGVYLQVLDPQWVTEFALDERGFLTFIRIDTPRTRQEREATGRWGTVSDVLTETWSKEEQVMRQWNHRGDIDISLARLGEAGAVVPFSEMGIDFIPIVYQPLRDADDGRGNGCFTPTLDKIDEASRMATRLHQLLFRYNRADKALEGQGQDNLGRPLPPPSVNGIAVSGANANEIEIEGEKMWQIPSGWRLTHLVAPIDYASHLAALNAMMSELEQDLPELAYYRLREQGNLSGRAVRFLLSDAVDRVLEARGNGEAAIARANAMALTIGAAAGLPTFSDIGTYENGDFDHTFQERPVLPADAVEMAQTVQSYVQAGASIFGAARVSGHSEQEAELLSSVDIPGAISQ